MYVVEYWSWWTDLNPRPADYKSAALPTELHQHSCAATIIIIAQLRGTVKHFFDVFLFQSFRMQNFSFLIEIQPILAIRESENNFCGTGSLTERASAAGTIQDLSGRCGHATYFIN
jgi:hypothetical protein